ncbi:MAG: GDSL-type esterase/lipase family protein [Acidobacteriota bacterium]
MENWNENFYGWNAANFAWGGDTTRNILWRLNDGELDGVHPKVIVLQAGTNDLGWRPPTDGGKSKVEEITKGIEAIIKVMQDKAPEATIILTGIFPRNDNVAWLPAIQETNRNLEKMADGKKVRYININDKLADADGMLYEGMTDPDKLHLALAGYQIWADALKPLLTELLGPPAKEDHAPPPTGNPAAGK